MMLSRIPVGELTLHVAEAGPKDGPLLVLLHGFPEFYFEWREYITALAADGFHVVAPDQRGYNLSDKPSGIDAYRLDNLANDILALADHFGQAKFQVVGHDWGASVAWWLATIAPNPAHAFRRSQCSAPGVVVASDAGEPGAAAKMLVCPDVPSSLRP